jgi:hypothetical protein
MLRQAVCYHRRMSPRGLRRPGAALLLFVLTGSLAATKGPPDPLLTARRLYNQGQYDQALEAAQMAASNPSIVSSARLVMGRARLERYRQTPIPAELDTARTELRGVDPRAIDARERIELQVGFAELLYFEDRYGAAAELLDPVIDQSTTLAPEAHDRALDWWATALDRQAQSAAPSDRGLVHFRIGERMEQELRRDPTSVPASYWLAASARGAGDLDRAWSAASAGWIRAALARERGDTLRADLDKLVLQAIIPERAARLPQKDRRPAAASMTADWEAFKKIW